MILAQALRTLAAMFFIRSETYHAKLQIVLQAAPARTDFTVKTRARCEQYWRALCLPKGKQNIYQRGLESIQPHSDLQIALAAQLFKSIPQTHFKNKQKEKESRLHSRARVCKTTI